MSKTHPVTPGLRLAEVALVLAGALAGSPVPRRLAAVEIAPTLARGIRECGGLDGVRHLDERNLALNRAVGPYGAPTREQRLEKQAIWSGGRQREFALIDLAFEVLNARNNWHPAPGTARVEK